ncbi:uncharacterized protein LOC133631786 [Entelurus aequoreus]|uniref:uncharacterized protein LOC133631786 n=1 Tax=Entelurus aequoreus TaxID=161455 RepID=UPI002B1DAF5A|nr:uncharacterized protein LOC133631786 [Entelurus aequoreus]
MTKAMGGDYRGFEDKKRARIISTNYFLEEEEEEEEEEEDVLLARHATRARARRRARASLRRGPGARGPSAAHRGPPGRRLGRAAGQRPLLGPPVEARARAAAAAARETTTPVGPSDVFRASPRGRKRDVCCDEWNVGVHLKGCSAMMTSSVMSSPPPPPPPPPRLAREAGYWDASCELLTRHLSLTYPGRTRWRLNVARDTERPFFTWK